VGVSFRTGMMGRGRRRRRIKGFILHSDQAQTDQELHTWSSNCKAMRMTHNPTLNYSNPVYTISWLEGRESVHCCVHLTRHLEAKGTSRCAGNLQWPQEPLNYEQRTHASRKRGTVISLTVPIGFGICFASPVLQSALGTEVMGTESILTCSHGCSLQDLRRFLATAPTPKPPQQNVHKILFTGMSSGPPCPIVTLCKS